MRHPVCASGAPKRERPLHLSSYPLLAPGHTAPAQPHTSSGSPDWTFSHKPGYGPSGRHCSSAQDGHHHPSASQSSCGMLPMLPAPPVPATWGSGWSCVGPSRAGEGAVAGLQLCLAPHAKLLQPPVKMTNTEEGRTAAWGRWPQGIWRQHLQPHRTRLGCTLQGMAVCWRQNLPASTSLSQPTAPKNCVKGIITALVTWLCNLSDGKPPFLSPPWSQEDFANPTGSVCVWGSGQGEAAAPHLRQHRPGGEWTHPLPSRGAPEHWQGGVRACWWGRHFPMVLGGGMGLVPNRACWGGASGHSLLHPLSSGWRRQGVLGDGQRTHLSFKRQTDSQGAFRARSVNSTNSHASQVRAGSHGGFGNSG